MSSRDTVVQRTHINAMRVRVLVDNIILSRLTKYKTIKIGKQWTIPQLSIINIYYSMVNLNQTYRVIIVR